MDKNRALKIVNPMLFIALLVQAGTGVILAFHLFISKPGLFVAVGELHEYTGFVFVALALSHLYLNWGWVRSRFLRNRGPKADAQTPRR
jgi:hypothetical protein